MYRRLAGSGETGRVSNSNFNKRGFRKRYLISLPLQITLYTGVHVNMLHSSFYSLITPTLLTPDKESHTKVHDPQGSGECNIIKDTDRFVGEC